eukprot:XP_017177106.1 PREDICTED: SP140 nuclear body protein family member isoform X3 [Mus musculus]
MSVIIQPLVASCKPVSTSAWNLSPRTIPEDQNEEESDDYQLMFKHFKENKVEIASAITKPFPFLMSLRDRDFISEQKFQEYQETCKNLVPVERVVYDILSNVQKKFSRDLLKVIFSKTHLKAYPDLKETLKHFFLNASKTNDEQAEEMQCNGGEGSNSCEQTRQTRQEPQDDLPSSLRQEAGAQQPTREKKCSCVICSPTYVPEDLEARMGSSQGECVGTRRNIPARKPKKQRRKKKGHNWSKPRWRKPMSVQRKRLRRRRKENANFSAELLPVTCGNLKGVLHKEKFKQGISVKSIQCQNGNWFTPSEFEMMGGYGKSKNWKLSLRCHNWPLKLLIQRNFLPNPPRIHRKRKEQRTQNLHRSPADPSIQNSDKCEVCRDGGLLFCCDTCFRAFHEDCHIPTVEAEITPWSCIFCRMQSLGSQPSLPESEILQREMAPQEQLFREMTVSVQEPMWLDIIKKKLSDQAYCQVEDFVQDMRLIFRNHKITFKDPKFGEMGFRLESKFEKSFKEVFAIQETNEKS